jgi:hypothetical protein
MKLAAILAALLAAAPAVAQSYPGDDDAWQQDQAPPPEQGQEDYGYGTTQGGPPQYGQPAAPRPEYGQPQQYQPPPMPGEPYGQPEPGEQVYTQPLPPQSPQQGPTYADFESDPNLISAGVWVETPQYGRVWRPTRVDAGWQPYLYGHWAWTDAGWAWISDEPFGWATYHYGRWAVLDDGSWVWLPGRIWAPAWVAWRYDEGYSAWCPLGPRGIVYERPRQWVVVDNRHFLEPARRYVVPVQRRREIIFHAQVYRGPRAGPPVVSIGRATGQVVRPLVVTDGGSRHTQVNGGAVQFYRPRSAPVVVTRQPNVVTRPQDYRPPREVQGSVPPPREVQRQQPGRPPLEEQHFGRPEQDRNARPEQQNRTGSPAWQQQPQQQQRVVPQQPRTTQAPQQQPPRPQGQPVQPPAQQQQQQQQRRVVQPAPPQQRTVEHPQSEQTKEK